MYLNIDFYSKYEVSVDQNLDGLYEVKDKEFRSLMLYSTFLTRIYNDFGQQPVGKVLSSILRRFDQTDYQLIIDRKYLFPSTESLSEYLNEDSIDIGVDLDDFERLILQPMPEVVSPRLPKGKYGLQLTLSPCYLKLKGFNLFSRELNYYCFQAVFATIRNYAYYYHSIGCAFNDIGFASNFISFYYQKYGTEYFFNAEGFALEFIKRQIMKLRD